MDTVLTVTEDAFEKILLVRDREDDANELSLWIEVTGVDAFGKFGYDLWLAPVQRRRRGRCHRAHGGITSRSRGRASRRYAEQLSTARAIWPPAGS